MNEKNIDSPFKNFIIKIIIIIKRRLLSVGVNANVVIILDVNKSLNF